MNAPDFVLGYLIGHFYSTEKGPCAPCEFTSEYLYHLDLFVALDLGIVIHLRTRDFYDSRVQIKAVNNKGLTMVQVYGARMGFAKSPEFIDLPPVFPAFSANDLKLISGAADVKIRMLQGVSSADSHHTANALVIGTDGCLYWSRGVFHVTNMETPTKTFRSTASGVSPLAISRRVARASASRSSSRRPVVLANR